MTDGEFADYRSCVNQMHLTATTIRTGGKHHDRRTQIKHLCRGPQ